MIKKERQNGVPLGRPYQGMPQSKHAMSNQVSVRVLWGEGVKE